jgi:hypothetical protein
MNAFVTYEEEGDTVAIHRVYVGEGKVRSLLRDFYREVSQRFGPQPLVRYLADGSPDPDSEQILNNWRATVHAAKNPHKFGDWLVEKHGWIECEDVQQDSL